MEGDETDQHFQEVAVSSLTGFLFGNIDEKGELEEDFLDEVTKVTFIPSESCIFETDFEFRKNRARCGVQMWSIKSERLRPRAE